jgi:cobalt-precorrin-5B (C1)-methyltransferase
VARAVGHAHVAAATGSVSEAGVRQIHRLPDSALIDMGDFAGGTLKYLRVHPVPRLTLAGGFGKLTKLAQGHLFLHSARSRVDLRALGETLASLGASAALLEEASQATTAAQVLALANRHGLPIADAIAAGAKRKACDVLRSREIDVEVYVFDRRGEAIGHAAFDAGNL